MVKVDNLRIEVLEEIKSLSSELQTQQIVIGLVSERSKEVEAMLLRFHRKNLYIIEQDDKK